MGHISSSPFPSVPVYSWRSIHPFISTTRPLTHSLTHTHPQDPSTHLLTHIYRETIHSLTHSYSPTRSIHSFTRSPTHSLANPCNALTHSRRLETSERTKSNREPTQNQRRRDTVDKDLAVVVITNNFASPGSNNVH